MEGIKLRFSDSEIKKLLSENLMILYDTREQVNDHILSWFETKKIPYKRQVINEGDYTAIIKARPDMGIYRDLYFKVGVERKNSVDELAGNLGEKTDTRDDIRLERELIRAKMKGIKMFLVIEDPNGLQNIIKGNYRSQYKPNSFIGKLTSLQDKYIQNTVFTSNLDTGYHIFRILYYAVRNFLIAGDINKEMDLDEMAEIEILNYSGGF
ncbi:ERCC4 domain-containing protein [Clostridium beijerinckii]|uniref:ERCC4 domain-containing protein n=1 Tax=Clostridium beijerinckii TaxID=1520 RepID=UPI00232C7562|nr:ERCC4 domain-containing protein [Clostridium beijerinckii]